MIYAQTLPKSALPFYTIEGSLSIMAKKKRHMRLPNGIGSVHKIGDGKNRRKPWRARVPSHLEFNADTGKCTQKYIVLGYYETETEAISALFDYRKDPYTLDAAKCTFSDVYEMWSVQKYKEVSRSAKNGYVAAYKHSEPLHKLKIREIRTNHMERIIATVNVGYDMKKKIKHLWNQMFVYAMEHDLVQKNYAEFVKLDEKPKPTTRTAISKDHQEKLWTTANEGDFAAELAVIYIYTGMRPSELLDIKKENVDIANRIMVGGSKTDAGKNRRIPLHNSILPMITRMMQSEGAMLVTRDGGKRISYTTYVDSYWTPLMDRLGMSEYTPHYTRHTAATIMREANIPEDIRKLILGHSTGDVTARYTHISDQMLVEAIDMIPSRKENSNVDV
jgi:integrase